MITDSLLAGYRSFHDLIRHSLPKRLMAKAKVFI